MFQGFKKATPYGGARKLRLTLPPVRRGTNLIVLVFSPRPHLRAFDDDLASAST